MGLDDVKKKAEGVVSSDKVEEVSDKVLDKAAQAAKKVTGGKFDSQVDSARDAADKAIGNK
ncbi:MULTISPECIES: Rv0909 family putative TA system antitoxin [unclassified Actinomyces]|uniref:Rv0909 family putative TA system antitoxin n=1 Tax=unclassified Actinomyces TaxID=2609248 RepID=UPI000D59CEDD|nr:MULTISPECIES: Rv0909 family putative TA system antitoxin [unclassified Actinomyces]RAX19744.1 antitoxin [Actinomyces sp. Z5]RAX22809.1 antitoxin [Actinomyces sp. Z3]